MSSSTDKRLRVAVLASGSGTNLQAIIDSPKLSIDLVSVVSDNPGALALERARRHNIEALCVDYATFTESADFHRALLQATLSRDPQLVILAGYMRIVDDTFVETFRNRLLNIHPALLPLYPGLDTYRRVLADKRQEHGSTVHFVTEELDAGPLVLQAVAKIRTDDTAESLQQRVQQMEYRIYPMAIQWFAEGRLSVSGDRAYLDDEPLPRMISAESLASS